MTSAPPTDFPHRHLLGIEGLLPSEISHILDLADSYVALNRRADKKTSLLRGRTQINLFFESSTRTRTSFELAGKRLGADVINMTVGTSSIKKGETLIDTAMTLNAMHPDVLVVRHPDSGAVKLLSEKVNCAVINAGDGSHEHPTQALLDALTIRRRHKNLAGLTVAICGDVAASRVARSGVYALTQLGADVTLIGPPTLAPMSLEGLLDGLDNPGRVRVVTDLDAVLPTVDALMLLRIQFERHGGGGVPSDYRAHWGLTEERAAELPEHAIVMHPGPVNRGLELDATVCDADHSVVLQQVTGGVAMRMAVPLDCLA